MKRSIVGVFRPWGDLPWTHLVDLPPGKVGFQGFTRVRPVAIMFFHAANEA